MSTNIETNLITDEALDAVARGRSFWSWANTIISLGGGPISTAIVPMVTPWAQVGHAVSNVVKVFKFW